MSNLDRLVEVETAKKGKMGRGPITVSVNKQHYTDAVRVCNRLGTYISKVVDAAILDFLEKYYDETVDGRE